MLLENVHVLGAENRLSVSLKLDLVFPIAIFRLCVDANVGSDRFSFRRDICS